MEWLPALYYLFVIAVCSWLFYEVTEHWKRLYKIQRIGYWVAMILLTLSLPLASQWLGSLVYGGQLEDLVYLGAKGDTLLTTVNIQQGFGNGSATSYRMEVLDLNTGKVLGKESVFDRVDYLIGFGDRIWFVDDYAGLVLRDAKTLKVLVDEDTLMEKNPQLQVGALGTFHLDAKKKQVVVTTEDGHNFAIDNDDFSLTEVTQDRFKDMDTIEGQQDYNDEYMLTDIILPNKENIFLMDEQARNKIMKEAGKVDVDLFPNASTDFLAGQFVEEGFTGKPVTLGSPNSWLVISKENLSDDERTIFSKVSNSDGKIVWQKKLFEPQNDEEYLEQVRVLNDNLILITDQRVMAFSSKDGSVLWTESL